MTKQLTLLMACGIVLATLMATLTACVNDALDLPSPPSLPYSSLPTLLGSSSLPSLPLPASSSSATMTPLRSMDPAAITTEQRTRFLAALDRQRAPRTLSGGAEVLIGVDTCNQIMLGRPPSAVTQALTSATQWAPEQAEELVTAAQQALCPAR